MLYSHESTTQFMEIYFRKGRSLKTKHNGWESKEGRRKKFSLAFKGTKVLYHNYAKENHAGVKNNVKNTVDESTKDFSAQIFTNKSLEQNATTLSEIKPLTERWPSFEAVSFFHNPK